MAHNDRVPVGTLLDDLAHAPNLRGALCATSAGRDWFDTDRDDPAVKVAVTICSICPVFADCRRWLLSLPDDARPVGVVAGVWRAPGGSHVCVGCGRVSSRNVLMRFIVRRGAGCGLAAGVDRADLRDPPILPDPVLAALFCRVHAQRELL